MALHVKVGLIGALDMLKFKNLAKDRRAALEKLQAKPLPKTYVTNEKAYFMHPKRQVVRIKAMRPNGPDGVTVTLEQGEWDPAENAFVPQKAVFTVVTEAGKPIEMSLSYRASRVSTPPANWLISTALPLILLFALRAALYCTRPPLVGILVKNTRGIRPEKSPVPPRTLRLLLPRTSQEKPMRGLMVMPAVGHLPVSMCCSV